MIDTPLSVRASSAAEFEIRRMATEYAQAITAGDQKKFLGFFAEDVIMMRRTADRLFGDQYHWSVLGAGQNQMRIAAQAAAMGGNVRVGLEDSVYIGRGELAKSNADQVAKMARILRESRR